MKRENKMKSTVNDLDIDGPFNKKGPIKYIVKMNIYYQEYRERIEINIIGGQKQKVILRMLWLVCYNF